MSGYYMLYDTSGRELDRGFEHEETVELEDPGPSYHQNASFATPRGFPSFSQLGETLEDSFQTCNFCNYPVQGAREGDRCPICYYPIKIKGVQQIDNCPLCDFPAEGPDNLESHIEGVHRNINQNDAIFQFCLRWEDKGYQCPFCLTGKICVKDSRMLCNHMSIHHVYKVRDLYTELQYLHEALDRSYDTQHKAYICPFGCLEAYRSLEPFKVHLQLLHKEDFVQLMSDLKLNQLMLQKYGIKTAPDQFPKQLWPGLTQEDFITIKRKEFEVKWSPVKKPGQKNIRPVDLHVAAIPRDRSIRLETVKVQSRMSGQGPLGTGLKVIRRSYDTTMRADQRRTVARNRRTPLGRYVRKRKATVETEEGGDEEQPEASGGEESPKKLQPLRKRGNGKQNEENADEQEGEKEGEAEGATEEAEGTTEEAEGTTEEAEGAEKEAEPPGPEDGEDAGKSPTEPAVVDAPQKDPPKGLYAIRKKYVPPEDKPEPKKKTPRARKTVAKKPKPKAKKADDEDYEPPTPKKPRARKSITPRKKKQQEEKESESSDDEPRSSKQAKKAQPRTLKQAREASAKKKAEPPKEPRMPLRIQMKKRKTKQREILDL